MPPACFSGLHCGEGEIQRNPLLARQRVFLIRESKMKTIKIDGRDYDYDVLPDDVKKQLQSIQFVDVELGRLAAQAAVFKTARLAYAKALTQALQAPSSVLAQQLAGDTLKLG